jgi:hypothetical protein
MAGLRLGEAPYTDVKESNGQITFQCMVPNCFPIGIYHCKIYNLLA